MDRRQALRLGGALGLGVLGTLAACGAPGPDDTVRATPSTATPSGTPTAGPTATPRPPAAPRTVTLVLSGDLLWHNTLWTSAAEDARRTRAGGPYDFEPLFAPIRAIVSGADLAIAHQEVPLGLPGGPFRNYPRFLAPPQTATALRATGWDACTTASNHSLDDDWPGLVRTLDVLDANGLAHNGTFRAPDERTRPTVLTSAAGVRVGLVAATYGTNGLPLPKGREWSVGLLDLADLLARARAARAAGADLVAVAMHAGDEYQTRPTAQQVDLATALAASDDVDLVYGHHAHVVQPWTTIGGKPVVYGLGNLVAQHSVSMQRGQEGTIARLTFSETGSGRFRATTLECLPTLCTRWNGSDPVRVLPVLATLAQGSAVGAGLRAQLTTALTRTKEAVGSGHVAVA